MTTTPTPTTQDEWLGWYWLPAPDKDGNHWLANCDRRGGASPFRPGLTQIERGPVLTCHRGLHASKRALDALQYAESAVVARVRLSGEMDHDDNKSCATERTILWMADATQVLHEFACDVAEKALLSRRELGDEPDPRSWAAIEAKRKWLRGELSDSELEAARAAAWEAARDAARAAARAAQNKQLEDRLFALAPVAPLVAV